MMTFIAPTPAIPSARQWCIRVTIPVRPPCNRTRVKSQSGRPLFEPRTHDLRSQRFELLLGPVLEGYFADVVPDVEVSIELPAWKAKVEGRKHHSLEIAGNQRKLRLNECPEILRAGSRPRTRLPLRY